MGIPSSFQYGTENTFYLRPFVQKVMLVQVWLNHLKNVPLAIMPPKNQLNASFVI